MPAPGACIWGNQVSFLIMFGGSSSQVDRRRDIDDTTTDAFSSCSVRQEGEAPRDHVSRPRANVEILARRRSLAMHHVQRTPGLTGAPPDSFPHSIRASGVLIWLSRLGSPIFWAGCPGWRTAARSFSASALPKNASDFSSTTTVKLDRLMERERRRRCCRAQSRATNTSHHPVFSRCRGPRLGRDRERCEIPCPAKIGRLCRRRGGTLVCLRSETAVCVSLATLHRATGKQAAGKLSVSQRG